MSKREGERERERESEAQSAHAPTQSTCFIVESINLHDDDDAGVVGKLLYRQY
jgi:hypothetical protein